MGYFNQYFNEDFPSFSIVIDDDDKVCYAYLYEKDQIVGDVWLYNHIETPKFVDWMNKKDLPFANPEMYVKQNIPPFDELTNIEVKWGMYLNEIYSEIYVSNFLLAKLKIGSLPGWSTLVKKDGPLALVYKK